MGFTEWLFETGFTLLQSVGIIGGLWYAARSFRMDARVRRVGNLLEIIEHHRQIWSQLYVRPKLARVRDESPDLKKYPITIEEELFVTQVILHLSGVFEATREGVIYPFDGATEDIREFFSRPIPNEVWCRKRIFQNRSFVRFLDQILEGPGPGVLATETPRPKESSKAGMLIK
jgi:hypothetical protein